LAGTKSEAMRRLQMGALGVVAVLLLIGLASIIKDSATQTENVAVPGAAPTTAPGAAPAAADPLAEAGVVPEIPADTPATGAATPSAATDAR
jgi:N-acetyl-gamma-glutamylphosphate reductase